ncbi:uncharacterized protein LOC107851658 isoform X1 [Capsicum annuum]|uniref:uncharacterized protein LOC107851658 isoform X1 n=1 Tax=Capsicum annuum TaxID=4072 RepID=UPI0007BF4F8C|nr:uncharacterized protein LOC107851658 isoform X1 [Capsicum annuum]
MDPSVQEILSFLKKKFIFEDKDLIFMQDMLMGCEKNFKNELEKAKKNFEEEKRKVEERYKKIIAESVEGYKEEVQLLYDRIDELKNENSKNEKKLREYYEKFNELSGRVSRLVEEMGEIDEVEFNSAENCSGKLRNEGVDNVNLVPTEKSSPGDQSFQYAPSVCASAKVDTNCNEQKESGRSDEADLDVETAVQPESSGATGVNLTSNNLGSSQVKDGVIDSHEMHFSHGLKSVCTSAGNSSGQSSHKGIDNINLVPPETNCPGDQSFQCAPYACDSGRVESNSDKQKENDHSQGADPLPVDLALEHGDRTRHPSASKAVDCFNNNLNAASDKPESSPVIRISDSDDEMNTNETACASNRCGLGVNLTCWPQKKGVHKQDSSKSTQKRKRSTDEGDRNRSFVGDDNTNLECSSKFARVVPFPEQNSVSLRQCEDKVGVKCHSELPPGRSDKPNVFSNGNDSDSCNTGKIEMFVKQVCALYRQQISENKSSYSMSQNDEMSITALGKCLIDGDPENKLRVTMSEVSLKDHQKCKRLAIRYCHQLFQIYDSKRDRLFCTDAGVI